MNFQRSLLFAKKCPINDKISINIPTLSEIINYGEDQYLGMVRNLTATPFDLMVELDDIGIDYETISDFQLFILMFKSLQKSDKDTSIIFGDLKLTNFVDVKNVQNGERAMYDPENDIVIDEMIALDIAEALRAIHHFERPISRAGNSEAKRYMIDRKRRKQMRERNKPYKSYVEGLIVPLVNTEEFKYNFETVQDITIYQLISSFRQIQKKKSWDQVMSGVYAGNIDAQTLNMEKISWLSSE